LDQVEEDLKKTKVRNWKEKCKDRRLWNEIVKQAKTPPRVVAPSEEEEERPAQREHQQWDRICSHRYIMTARGNVTSNDVIVL
jgi:hypothetical protein